MSGMQLRLVLTTLTLMVSASIANAQGTTDTTTASRRLAPERQAQLARRGGGVRVGIWDVRGPEVPDGGRESETPAFEGYVRKGLDAHLALENSVGFWRYRQAITTAEGPLGAASTSRVDAYVVPQQTSVVFFPVTRPDQRIEPFLRAGIGLTLGIEDRKGGGGGLFSAGGEGIRMVVGFGATGGGGVEWRLTDALGISASGRYQWVRFLEELAGSETYQGLGADLGITYRFQFR